MVLFAENITEYNEIVHALLKTFPDKLLPPSLVISNDKSLLEHIKKHGNFNVICFLENKSDLKKPYCEKHSRFQHYLNQKGYIDYQCNTYPFWIDLYDQIAKIVTLARELTEIKKAEHLRKEETRIIHTKRCTLV